MRPVILPFSSGVPADFAVFTCGITARVCPSVILAGHNFLRKYHLVPFIETDHQTSQDRWI
jgi:hypothetical protein